MEKDRIINEERELNKKVFFVIPSNYSELLEITVHCSNNLKIYCFTFFALVCVFGVLVAKMTI